jgi:hypothetical protein
VTVPSAKDLDIAKEDALLQLKIGRGAHYYIVLASAALFVDGFLVLFVQPSLGGLAPSTFRTLYFLVPPLVGGVYLSFFGLRLKWEVFQLWPWEKHFWLTVGAVLFNLVLVGLLTANLIQIGPTARWTLLPAFYPLSLLAISAPVIALAMTWPGWARPKLYSVVAALIPVPMAAVLYIPAPSTSAIVSALAVTLFASAFLYQTAGSFLHLMASGTQPHEKALIASGQSKMFLMAEEVRKREDALRMREGSLAKREADVEVAQASVGRQHEALEEARKEIDTLEEDLKKRSDALSGEQRTWAEKTAQLNSAAQVLEDKGAALRLKEEELDQRTPQVSAREQRAIAKEGELTQRSVGFDQRDAELGRRAQQLTETESRLEARRQELDRKNLQHLQQESELRSRLTLLGTNASVSPDAAVHLREIEQREAHLAQLKIVLDEQNVLLGRKAREAETLLAEARKKIEQNMHFEAALSERESALRQKESEASQGLDAANQRFQRYEATTKQYETRFAELERREAEVGHLAKETARLNAALQQQQAALKEREAALQKGHANVEQIMREALENQKRTKEREMDLKLREEALLGLGGTSSAWDEGQPKWDPRWGPRPTVSSRPPPTGRIPASAPEAAASASPAPIVVQVPPTPASGRQSSGIPRLDNLLHGGIAPRDHVLLIGPPFVGKEAVLYAFLAEGMKRGQRSILVTAARPPEEVSQEIARFIPSFVQEEKAGHVVWIDATNRSPGTAPAPTNGSRILVNGPMDHAGILTSLVSATKRVTGLQPSNLRVGFLGLASCLAHGEPTAGFTFLQNFVGILKPRNALAMYAIDSGTLSDAQIATIQSRVDGAIQFQTDRGKTFLSVQGLGEVETRDWIEYRATEKSVTIGSFALERIR